MNKNIISILLLTTFIACFTCSNIASVSSKEGNFGNDATINTNKEIVINKEKTNSDTVNELIVANGFSRDDIRDTVVLQDNNIGSYKDYVFDRMLNSIDFFSSIQATYSYESIRTPRYYSTYCIELGDVPRSKELIFDNGKLSFENYYDGTYYTKIDLSDKNQKLDIPMFSESDSSADEKVITKGLINSRTKISESGLSEESIVSKKFIDVKSNINVDYVSKIASKSRVQYMPEIEDNTFYYRDNTPMLTKSNVQYFSQDFAFGFLSNFDIWTVEGTSTILGRECFIVSGEIDGFYSEKMNTQRFEMLVDKEIGALLMIKGYDENNKISLQLKTYEFVVDEKIDDSVFKGI